ncbi:AAA-like domain-containing protein [Acaryochloris sp. IP29b_bin.137]|uniref:AAA-like domain-containing protein n=1 Tax=Acaryochloris sp. IP29b_bin.137 TaxID=2969217 RepID=UPI00261A1CBA|nr:AAA-like domain-containing protein [Acaryochloris sp. IP29b_bin.137]
MSRPYEELVNAANQAVFRCDNEYLKDIEVDVLELCLEGLTYEKIAEKLGYAPGTIAKDVAHKLFRKLTRATGESVKRSNLREVLRRLYRNLLSFESFKPYPMGPLPLNSPFYLKRSDDERRCCFNITNPGTLIRIRGVRATGKTSLVNRILQYAEAHQHQTAYLDFQWASQALMNDLERFLQWMSLLIGNQLGLENKLDEYWDSDVSIMLACNQYFEEYLLPSIEDPLVLGLDSLEEIFPNAELASEVLTMLRFWHEQSKSSVIWEKLRLVITHDTECYVPLNQNYSPFNVGEPITLDPFLVDQAQELAERYELKWGKAEIRSLCDRVGGHPALIHLAIYIGAVEGMSCQKVLETSDKDNGIFIHQLRRLREELLESEELTAAYRTVVNNPSGIELNSLQIYHLKSLGLIKLEGNLVVPFCSLYKEYFQRELGCKNGN